MGHSSLITARNAKDDEFYTRPEEVELELAHYAPHFSGRVVYCNCDAPGQSAFWQYFDANFSKLGLSGLIATHYDPYGPCLAHMRDRSGLHRTRLAGNGDFRSEACLDLLKQSDIVITNPPFSLFREYLDVLMRYDKKFLIIGSLNAITYKDTFRWLKEDRMWLGYHSPKAFLRPDGSEQKFGNILWYTNLDISKRHVPLVLTRQYAGHEAEYPDYDNYAAIEVPRVHLIPGDYPGVMGVPITFLDKYCPSQFEILGLGSGRCEFDRAAWPVKRYVNAVQHNADGSVQNGGKANTRPCILCDTNYFPYYTANNLQGCVRCTYARILIRRKP